jgi:4a-hydroxytetrahydrobiopterin dehydratase
MSLFSRKCVACNKNSTAISSCEANALLQELSGWTISGDGKWLEKSYKFKNFVQALDFTNKVGKVAEAQNHHPDIMLGWGYVNIKLQTHAVGGLHENDFILGAKIDAL